MPRIERNLKKEEAVPFPFKVEPVYPTEGRKVSFKNASDWVAEPDWNGPYAVAYLLRGNARLDIQGENKINIFPEFKPMLERLASKHETVLQGRIVHITPPSDTGNTDEEREILEGRLSSVDPREASDLAQRFPCALIITDIHYLDGTDLRKTKEEVRRKLLTEDVGSEIPKNRGRSTVEITVQSEMEDMIPALQKFGFQHMILKKKDGTLLGKAGEPIRKASVPKSEVEP